MSSATPVPKWYIPRSPIVNASNLGITVQQERPLHPRERAERATRGMVTVLVLLVLTFGFL